MHRRAIDRWRHDHVFGQDQVRAGERRTLVVVALTLVTMAVEIPAGILFGSMALLADGLHMGTHAVALGITAGAYIYARRHARDPRFSFGTGKVNSLAGFAGAVLLGVFAVSIAVESVLRILTPVEIAFGEAIAVAFLGLVVNGISVVVLGGHGHGHHHHHHHHHDDESAHHADGAGTDHALRSAYLHVLADALTSILAIAALVGGWLLGAVWLDPVMGMVGAALVARWSVDLLRRTGSVLLDRQAPQRVRQRLSDALESNSARIADLHVWSIGPGNWAAIVVLVDDDPQAPEAYKALVPAQLEIHHLTIEVHRCPAHPEPTVAMP